jgi:hypothetical protein
MFNSGTGSCKTKPAEDPISSTFGAFCNKGHVSLDTCENFKDSQYRFLYSAWSVVHFDIGYGSLPPPPLPKIEPVLFLL